MKKVANNATIILAPRRITWHVEGALAGFVFVKRRGPGRFVEGPPRPETTTARMRLSGDRVQPPASEAAGAGVESPTVLLESEDRLSERTAMGLCLGLSEVRSP